MDCRESTRQAYFPEHRCVYIKQANAKHPGEACDKLIYPKHDKVVDFPARVRGKDYVGMRVCPRHLRALRRANLMALKREQTPRCAAIYVKGKKKGTKCQKPVAPDSDRCFGHFNQSKLYEQFLAWRAHGGSIPEQKSGPEDGVVPVIQSPPPVEAVRPPPNVPDCFRPLAPPEAPKMTSMGAPLFRNTGLPNWSFNPFPRASASAAPSYIS